MLDDSQYIINIQYTGVQMPDVFFHISRFIMSMQYVHSMKGFCQSRVCINWICFRQRVRKYKFMWSKFTAEQSAMCNSLCYSAKLTKPVKTADSIKVYCEKIWKVLRTFGMSYLYSNGNMDAFVKRGPVVGVTNMNICQWIDLTHTFDMGRLDLIIYSVNKIKT